MKVELDLRLAFLSTVTRSVESELTFIARLDGLRDPLSWHLPPKEVTRGKPVGMTLRKPARPCDIYLTRNNCSTTNCGTRYVYRASTVSRNEPPAL